MAESERLEGQANEDPDQGQAFDALVVDALPALRRRSKLMSRDAEDLSQAALVRALRHRASFDRHRPIGPWLHAIAGRLARERPRDSIADAHRLAMGVEPTPYDDLSRDPAEILDDNSLSPEFEAAWSDLPERQRATLWLCAVDGFSVPEAARILGEAPKAVESRLLRAKTRFRAHFDGTRPGPRVAFAFWAVHYPALGRVATGLMNAVMRPHPLVYELLLAVLAVTLVAFQEPA